jgi:hypothetical protein
VAVGGLVEQMYETHKLDILVDLDGFGVPQFHMLFAVQAAPIQISFLGWPASTGSCPTRACDPIGCVVHYSHSSHTFETSNHRLEFPPVYSGRSPGGPALFDGPLHREADLPAQQVFFSAFSWLFFSLVALKLC